MREKTLSMRRYRTYIHVKERIGQQDKERIQKERPEATKRGQRKMRKLLAKDIKRDRSKGLFATEHIAKKNHESYRSEEEYEKKYYAVFICSAFTLFKGLNARYASKACNENLSSFVNELNSSNSILYYVLI